SRCWHRLGRGPTTAYVHPAQPGVRVAHAGEPHRHLRRPSPPTSPVTTPPHRPERPHLTAAARTHVRAGTHPRRALPRDLTRRSRPCTRVREALSAQHDDEALPPSMTPMRITEHLAGCSACARFAGELDVLSGRIVSSDPRSSSALSSRILTTLAEAD